jgi:hypothetical protein
MGSPVGGGGVEAGADRLVFGHAVIWFLDCGLGGARLWGLAMVPTA